MAATILVVEDEPAIQELVACNLELAGHRTLRAESAEQAMQMVRDELPDLIVLDWMLPGINGVEFARRLRGDKRTQTVPLIMLTARADEQDKLAGLETGADYYITKPFSPRELNARVKAVLRRRSPQVTDDVVEAAGLQLDPNSHRVLGNGQPLQLAARKVAAPLLNPGLVAARQGLDEAIGIRQPGRPTDLIEAHLPAKSNRLHHRAGKHIALLGHQGNRPPQVGGPQVN